MLSGIVSVSSFPPSPVMMMLLLLTMRNAERFSCGDVVGRSVAAAMRKRKVTFPTGASLKG